MTTRVANVLDKAEHTAGSSIFNAALSYADQRGKITTPKARTAATNYMRRRIFACLHMLRETAERQAVAPKSTTISDLKWRAFRRLQIKAMVPDITVLDFCREQWGLMFDGTFDQPPIGLTPDNLDTLMRKVRARLDAK